MARRYFAVGLVLLAVWSSVAAGGRSRPPGAEDDLIDFALRSTQARAVAVSAWKGVVTTEYFVARTTRNAPLDDLPVDVQCRVERFVVRPPEAVYELVELTREDSNEQLSVPVSRYYWEIFDGRRSYTYSRYPEHPYGVSAVTNAATSDLLGRDYGLSLTPLSRADWREIEFLGETQIGAWDCIGLRVRTSDIYTTAEVWIAPALGMVVRDAVRIERPDRGDVKHNVFTVERAARVDQVWMPLEKRIQIELERPDGTRFTSAMQSIRFQELGVNESVAHDIIGIRVPLGSMAAPAGADEHGAWIGPDLHELVERMRVPSTLAVQRLLGLSRTTEHQP